MVMVRQQYVIYQVEIHVIEGVANFDPPISLNGLKAIHPKHGWVPMDIISGYIADEAGEMTNDEPSENQSSANGRGRLIGKPTTSKAKEEREVDPRSPIARAKESFSHHQYHTLKKLERQGVHARIRVSSFERRETIMEVDKSIGVPIFDSDPDDYEDSEQFE